MMCNSFHFVGRCSSKLLYLIILLLFILGQHKIIQQLRGDPDTSLVSEYRDKIPSNLIVRKKIILYWSTYYREGAVRDQSIDNCPSNLDKICVLTGDRSLLHMAHALVFYRDSMDPIDLPPHRHIHQRYVYMSYEPPTFAAPDADSLSHFFNWTMTLRMDSDVPNTFGSMERTAPSKAVQLKILRVIKSKKKFATAVVSNCVSSSKREVVTQKLMEKFDITMFGKCSNRTWKCYKHANNELCWRDVERTYWFYLAFENSVCRDYVTEKFWQIVKYLHIVPIVLNRRIMENVNAPPNSYIAVDDYVTLDGFVSHLTYLMTNTSAYMEYLAWKWSGYEIVDYSTNTGFCRLCRNLWDASLPSKSYANLTEWFIRDSQCASNYASELLPERTVVQYS